MFAVTMQRVRAHSIALVAVVIGYEHLERVQNLVFLTRPFRIVAIVGKLVKLVVTDIFQDVGNFRYQRDRAVFRVAILRFAGRERNNDIYERRRDVRRTRDAFKIIQFPPAHPHVTRGVNHSLNGSIDGMS